MDRDRAVTGETEDPTGGRADPRCPSCGEPVGARAQHCIHCWADLPDDTEYDDVTGGTHEVTHERDRVTAETGEVTAGTPTVDDGTGEERSDPLELLRAATAGNGSRERDAPPVPSGRGTDGPSFLPTLGIDWERAGRFLAGLGVAGAVAVVAGLSPPVAGVLVAGLAWAGSTAWVARERSGFDAMRYGSMNLMSTLVFVAFAVSVSAAESPVVPLALLSVPVAVSALLVGGLGDTVTEYDPGRR